MPIRPIDMISIAPRSQEASQQQLSDQNKLAHAHENMAQQFGTSKGTLFTSSVNIKENSESVIQSSKGEKTEYRYDAREKGKGNKGKARDGKQKKQQQQGDEKTETQLNQSKFDIKI